jgi:hypothetical protein
MDRNYVFYKYHEDSEGFSGSEAEVYIMNLFYQNIHHGVYAVRFQEITIDNEINEILSVQKMLDVNQKYPDELTFSKIIWYNIYRDKKYFNSKFPELSGYLQFPGRSLLVYTTEVLSNLGNLIYLPIDSILELLIGYLKITSEEKFIIGDIHPTNIMWRETVSPRNYQVQSDIALSFIDYREMQDITDINQILPEFRAIVDMFIEMLENRYDDDEYAYDNFIEFLNSLRSKNDIDKITQSMISYLSEI